MHKKLSIMRSKLITQSEKRHGTIHALFGVLAFLIGYTIEPNLTSLESANLLTMALIASFLPDIDHFFYIFMYGKKKDYAKACRELLVKGHFTNFIKYVKKYHKHNTGIYSHNIGSVLLASFFTMYQLNSKDNITMFVFFLAWTFHYIYDILEDILFFKKPNKNWFFIFNRS